MADADDNNTGDKAGHRARMRRRLLDGGAQALQDYELIESLLALGLPRIDTKPIAKALLREFGTIGAVLTATPDALMRVKGVGETAAAAIKIAQATALALLKERSAVQPVLASWQALLDYLRADMAWLGIERVRVLHLNGKNMLIRDEVLSEGTIDQSAVHVRKVIRRAMELGSTSLILVHNHPSGDPQPSRRTIDARHHGGRQASRHRRARPCHRRCQRIRQHACAWAHIAKRAPP
jgi:DNA repair protein RadC